MSRPDLERLTAERDVARSELAQALSAIAGVRASADRWAAELRERGYAGVPTMPIDDVLSELARAGNAIAAPVAPEWMTVRQLADYLQMSVWRARQLCTEGVIRSTKIRGGRGEHRIRKQWADDHLEARATGGPAPRRGRSRAPKSA